MADENARRIVAAAIDSYPRSAFIHLCFTSGFMSPTVLSTPADLRVTCFLAIFCTLSMPDTAVLCVLHVDMGILQVLQVSDDVLSLGICADFAYCISSQASWISGQPVVEPMPLCFKLIACPKVRIVKS
jgi:hypothetical protein